MQTLSKAIWFQYMFSISFYEMLVVTQLVRKTKNKDHWEMLVHHVITILLIALSFVSNLHRLGSLVLVIINVPMIFLEVGRPLKYAKLHKTSYVTFIIFTISWIFFRVILYQYLVYVEIKSTLTTGIFPVRIIIDFLLTVLMIMIYFWTYCIAMFYIKIFFPKAVKNPHEERLSSDDSANSSQEDQHNMHDITNNKDCV